MNSFVNARIRLTVLYVAIIAIVSFSFSAIIYNGVVSDLERGFQMAEYRIRNPSGVGIPRRIALEILEEDFIQSRRGIIIGLFRMNGIIILASGVAAYVLAGKTIKPIEDALEEQKRFTADAGHELMTPLTALRTELEVALRDKKMKMGEARALLASNLEEVVSLQKLSENLMLLNRYAKTHNGMHFSQVNSNDFINSAVKKLSPIANLKKISIKLDLENTKLKADSQSMEELMVILIDNAIKYSPKGSEVFVSSKKIRNKLAIEIVDQGIGISKSDQEHLFDRFYRSDSSREKAGAGGYGLGLAIAKEIVERHSGEISVKSKLKNGSTFKVILSV